MVLQVHQFPCRSDNYGFLAHDPDAGVTACIDTPDADATNAGLEEKGWHRTRVTGRSLLSFSEEKLKSRYVTS